MRYLKLVFRFLVGFVLGYLAVTLMLGVAHAQTSRDISRDMARISELMPGFTVKVYVRMNGGTEQEGLATGSGELVRNGDGVVRILTNAHVVGNAETVYVQFDGQPFAQEVRVIGRGSTTRVDLALLEAPSPLPTSAKPIVIARTSLAIGQQVYALGYPSGNRQVSEGEINSLSSPHEDQGMGIFFTHQAPISPGSSGGPLVRFTATGEPELVGINTQVGVGAGGFITNVSYSIKPEVILRMLSKLETGLVAHAYAGILLTDTRRANPYMFGIYPPPQQGIVIGGVFPESPAARVGLLRGDIVKKVEKQTGDRWENLTSDSATTLRDRIFFDVPPGSVVRFTIMRGKEESQRTLTLEQFPVPQGRK